jgi:phosphoserine phosphatase RsbU/P
MVARRETLMQILIADDDPIGRRLAMHALAGCGADLAIAEDGHAAWTQVQERTQSTVVILDRLMPGIDGLDLCRRARLLPSFPPLYILMVTSASETTDITAGLEAGADDYVVKPFNAAELKARAQVGMRMVALQESMARRLAELEQALANVKQLRGLLPMCAYCKKIRVDDKYWQQLEGYLADHSEAEFSHGICPECFPSVIEGMRNDTM